MHALSGGMAQRLMVARSIFDRPAVLFMDEPTSGLDPQGRLALRDLLHDLNAAGQTIVLTTHYMEEADAAVWPGGDHGSWPDLGAGHPRGAKQGVDATPSTVKAGGDQERLARTMQTSLDGVTRIRRTDAGLQLHVRGGNRLLARVMAAAETDGFEVADLSVAEPSLETVFISLTGKELRD